MSNYANHTCHKCGIRLPQPEMVNKVVSYEAGSSNTGLSKRTIFGVIFDEKSSQKAFNKWLWSPSKRVYKRRRKVWMCKKCADEGSMGAFVFLVLVVLFIFWALN